MRPLHFVHFATFYPPYSFGGDAMYVYRLCHALADAGHTVDVIHCVDSYHLQHPGEPEVRLPEHPGVKRHELRSPFGGLSPFLTQQTGRPLLKAAKIQQVLDARPPDVLHFHNTSLIGLETLRMQPRAGRPVRLYMTHEHWLICPMHVLWKYTNRACDGPDCLRCTLHGKRPPQLWRYTGMIERTSEAVDKFVSPSRFTANMHAERGFPRKVEHLPYFLEPVDKDWQEPGERPQQKPYFLFVGRLELIKGLQDVIRLWDRIPDYDLLVVGGGLYGDQLREMAKGNPRIQFLGQKSQAQLGALYYHAQAVIVPSITYETFGVIIIEALARKTPVIVRDLGALPEVVKDSGGGFIFGNDEQLIAHIRRLADTPGLRDELGERGYAVYRQRWTKTAHMELYFEFLRQAALSRYGCVPWLEPERESFSSGKSSSNLKQQ